MGPRGRMGHSRTQATPQGGRWQLAENGTIGACETAEVAEALAPRSFRGGCREITHESVCRRVVQREGSAMPGGRHGARGPDPIEGNLAVGGNYAPAVGSATVQGSRQRPGWTPPTIPVSYDVGRLQFYTAREQAWSRLCGKRDDGPPGKVGRMCSPRNLVEEPLHSDAMEIDPDEFRGEVPAPGDGQLGSRCADRCRVIVEVSERVDGARRHLAPRSAKPYFGEGLPPALSLR